MSTYLEKIKDLVNTRSPKAIPTLVKKDNDLYEHLNQFYGDSLNEKVYNALYSNSNICKRGQKKTFRSLNQGYGFCGKPKNCSCAREAVSKNVSYSKGQKTDSEKQKTLEKRKRTLQKKYGVSNPGQTENSRKNHVLAYQDKDRVNEITQKVKQTKFQKYGNENYNNTESIKQTWRSTRPEYWQEKLNNENIVYLYDKEYLEKELKQRSPPEIADDLNVHVQTVYKHLNNHGIREPYKSFEEQSIENYLNDLGISNIVRNSRKVLNSKKELDFYLPDYDLAIEYNGVYWHHENINHIDKYYHWNKFWGCHNQNIDLVTVFSCYWKSKSEIVKTILKNKLNKFNDSVYARNCKVVELSSKDVKNFLDENHIQGYAPATVVLGLKNNDSLIAVMTFGKKRIAIGSKNNDCYELIRYSSNPRVVGGASKLLKHFKKEYSPEKIISFSNNEYSQGDLYRKLGFELESHLPPSYWYVKPRHEKFYHRFNFSKQKLVEMGYDSSKTEKQITQEMGLLKVWDCGKMKWVLQL